MVTVEQRGKAAWVTIDRPEVRNALDGPTVERLTEAVKACERNADVRCVVLTGAGDAFSAGADLAWMRRMADAGEDANVADAEALAGLMRAVDECSKPTIARVNGAAFGGAVGLVACCDYAVAVHTARFALSEVRLGLAPAVIAPHVVRAIGERAARRFFQSGEVFFAAEAGRIGLLHDVVEASRLDACVEAMAANFAAGAPSAQRWCKRLAHGKTAVGGNARLIARLRAGDEGRRGLDAFLSKRAVEW